MEEVVQGQVLSVEAICSSSSSASSTSVTSHSPFTYRGCPHCRRSLERRHRCAKSFNEEDYNMRDLTAASKNHSKYHQREEEEEEIENKENSCVTSWSSSSPHITCSNCGSRVVDVKSMYRIVLKIHIVSSFARANGGNSTVLRGLSGFSSVVHSARTH